jgi:hypothetical protein
MKTLQQHITELQGENINADVNIDINEDVFTITIEVISEVEIPFTEVLMPEVNAECDPHKERQEEWFMGDLSAECPFCNDVNGYVSTGEHPWHGRDIVICQECGNAFRIKW